MFRRSFQFVALIGMFAVAGSTGGSPIFCDRFEGEPCLDLPLIMLEAPDLETFDSGEILIELEEPAPAGGLEVFLSSSESNILDVPSSVTVQEFQSETAFPVSAEATYGTATIVAAGLNHRTNTVEVSVAPRSLDFVLGSLIGIGQSNGGEIELTREAPEGGATIVNNSSDESLVTISPAQITISEGEKTAPIIITGLEEGSVELSASATGYAASALTVSSTNQIVSIGNIPDLVPGESRSFPISLSQPAPAGGLTVLLESADPSIATVAASVEIPEGSRAPGANPQANGITIGSTVITARAVGFAPVSRPATVKKFQLTFSPDPVPLPVGWAMSVIATLSNSAPAEGLEITLTNQDNSIVTAPESIMIPAGQTTASVEISALNQGSSSLLAQANLTEDANVEIDVGPIPDIALDNFTVGEDLQGEHPVRLTASPANPVDLIVTVADPTIAVISPESTIAGTASIVLRAVSNTDNQNFYIQGLSQGTTTIMASAAGFNAVQATLTVTDSGFYISAPESISTTTLIPHPIVIKAAQLKTDGSWSSDQKVRPGLTVEVPVASADPAIGQMTTSPVLFEGGTGYSPSQSTNFAPIAVGTTTVSMTQPAGFTAPTDRNQWIEAEVGVPFVLEDFTVGKDLQGKHELFLGQLPPNPINIDISVADPTIAVISPERTAVGTTSITLREIHGPFFFLNFYVQGLSQGTTTLTASAAGVPDIEATLTVTDSGFYIHTPESISTTTLSSPTDITVIPARLNTDGSWSTVQGLRPGLTVEIPVVSADPGIGQITTSPVLFEGGTGAGKSTQFNPNTIGTTIVSMTQPTGFTAPTDRNQSIDAEVGTPDISLNGFAVGEDLQGQHRVNLAVSPADPVDLIITVADPAIAVISPERTTVGSASITFSSVSDSNNQNFYVQGLSQGTTAITASATGFNDVQANLTVTDSGFYISWPSSILTTPYSTPTDITISAARLNPNGTLIGFSAIQEVRAGLTVKVPVVSADPVVGQITTSPFVFEGGTGSSKTTQFDPRTVGTTTVIMTQPAGFTAPTNGLQSIDAEVHAPDIRLNDLSVGKDLQDKHRVKLAVSPPDPVDLVITVADPAIAVISPERTTVGSASITFSSVSNFNYQNFYVQGLSQGTTVITASAPGFNDVQASLTVTDSGFYISWPSSISTTPYSNPSDIRIRSAQVSADGSGSRSQEIRAGLTVEVNVASADPAVGQIATSPVVFEGGTGARKTTQFNPNTIGKTVVSMTQPAGFTSPINRNQSIDAEVGTPDISLDGFAVGEDLQGQHRVNLGVSPADPVDLIITVDDPAIAVISPERTTVGSASFTFTSVSNSNNQYFYVQGLSQGTTAITASATGFNDVQASLTVTDSGFYISWPGWVLTTTYANPTDITIRTVRLNAGWSWSWGQEIRAGLTVEVPVTSADPGVGQITTSPVVFEGGTGSSKTTRFDPVTAGTTTVSMTQPAGFTAPINLHQSINAEVRTPDISLNDFTVGQDLQDQHRVKLAVLPPDPVDLVITVADPAIAVISPESTAVGSASITLGDVSNTYYFYVQGLSQGTTAITASAPGFNDVQATLTVTDSGFYISGPSAISTTTYSNPTDITIRAARHNADGSGSLLQEVRAGLTVEVPVASADPAVGQITTSPVVFEGGTGSSKTTQFDPDTEGTTTVSMTQPAGFTTPTNGNQSIDAEVGAPFIAINDSTVGKNLQDQHRVNLAVSPPDPVDLVLTVADPSIAVISPERMTAGTDSITFSSVSNTNHQGFYVQGLSQGTTVITASAAGFNDAQATLTVTDSGFYISWPSSILTTTYSSPTRITIRAVRHNADGTFSRFQEVRGGLTVEVPVVSADPVVGQLTTSPVVFNGGTGSSKTTRFDPVTAGTTTVSMTQPAGFTAPINRNQSIDAEVRTPDISLNDFTVGQDLQDQHRVKLAVLPPDPVDLVITVADPAIAVISPESTAVGSDSITLGDVSNTYNQYFYVQGLNQGTTAITASAAGFNDVQATLTVTDSGFYISWPSSISTTTYSNPTDIKIRTAQLNADGSVSLLQEVRAGLTVEVPVASADPAVGQVTTSPVVFEGGTGSSKTTQFDPDTEGTTTISVTQPAEFTAPTDRNQSVDAEVRTPDISLNDLAVGEDLQSTQAVRLIRSPPDPVDLVVTVADPAIAVISTEPTEVGTASITLGAVSNTFNQTFYVQGLSQGTTTIMASAPGFNDVQASLAVTDSGFYIDSPASILTTTYSNPTNITINAARLHASGSWSTVQDVRAGLTVEVPVTSGDPTVGQITTSPVVFEGGTGATNTTQFDPNAVGTTTVSMIHPAGFTVPINRNQSIDVEVRTPDTSINDTTVGKDLQSLSSASLAVSPPDPVDLVITVADPAIALISPERMAAGTASITISAVSNTNNQNFYVHGLSQGTTTITASAAGFNDAQATLTVSSSGFYISSPSSISTTTYSSPTNITIRAARLNTNGSWSWSQEIRGGLTVEVPVVSAEPAVGQIATSPVVFEGGTGATSTTQFDPNAAGTTTVSMTQPTGFAAPTNRNQSIDAEVRTPDISLNDFTIGEDLQDQHRVNLGVSPPDPVDLIITVDGTAIAVISPERMAAGTASMTISAVSNTSNRNFYVQGLSQGTTTITASAAGFNDAQATLTVSSSGFYISSPSSISTTTYSSPTNITIRAARLHANGSWSWNQEIRGGLTVEVPVVSAEPAVGQITTSPVVFEGGTGATSTTQFDPNAAGTTTVNITQPTGFAAPTNRNQSIDAQVNDG